MSPVKKLYKSRQDSFIDGVCAGVAEHFNIDVTIVRVIWAASILLKGLGAIAYILAMLIIPANPDHEKTNNKQKNRNYGLIGGIALIVLGVMIMTDGFNWHFPHLFSWSYHFGDTFWPLLLIAGGTIYIVMILKKNKTADESGTAVSTGKEAKSAKSKQTKTASGHAKLTRNTEDKWVSGICSGFAEYFEIDPVFIRIGFIVTALLTHIYPLVIAYIVLLFVIPEE